MRRISAGFTLTELLLVVVLIALLTGLTFPRFKKSAEDFQMKSTAFDLYKMLQYAREKALTGGKNSSIRFEYKAGSYQLFPAEGRFSKKRRIPQGSLLRGKKEEIVCYPDGRCDVESVDLMGESGGFRIAVEDWGGSTRIYEIPR